MQIDLSLAKNQHNRFKITLNVPEAMAYSQPYWLVNEAKSEGTYSINDEEAGKDENDPAIVISAEVMVDDQQIILEVPVIYKWNDPVKGELYRPLNIIPAVSINVADPVLIFRKNQSREVNVTVKSGKSGISTVIRPVIAQGWQVTPQQVKVDLEEKGEEEQLIFKVTSADVQQTVNLSFEATLDGRTYTHQLTEIDYDHIPLQIMLTEARTKLVNIDVVITGSKIGYIHGAGDMVAQGLSNIGYEVDELSNGDINFENLKQYDAVVLGIRAVNTDDRFPYYVDDLMKYTNEGGTLVMQYCSSLEDTVLFTISHYTFQRSRDFGKCRNENIDSQPCRIKYAK